MDKSILEKLKQEHGRLFELSAGGFSVALRAATRAEYKRWQAQALDERKRSDAIENLLRSCIVYPDEKAVDAMLDQKPGLAITFGSELLSIIGLNQEVEKKEL